VGYRPNDGTRHAEESRHTKDDRLCAGATVLEQVEGETIETAVARTQLEEVWVAFQALQEHDEVLAEIIRHMREERGRTKWDDALTRRLGE